MGKNDFLTPKAIGNRIKAKGLQKLRWYCQMCQKQCRDENGFKCHLSSDSHRRQMEVFGQDPDRVIDGYSEEFHNTFIEHLKMAHPSARVEAHKVYNEFIQDRHHIHMNSTKWLTLSEYVKYLGKEGICTVEESPKGWFIRLVQREPADIEREAQAKKRKRAEMADGRREEKRLAAQAAAARDYARDDGVTDNGHADEVGDGAAQHARRGMQERDGPLQLSMQAGAARTGATDAAEGDGGAVGGAVQRQERRGAQLFDDDGSGGSKGGNGGGGEPHRKRNKVEELMAHEKARKEREASAAAAASVAPGHSGTAISGPWISEGIAVKVMAEQLGEGYYRKKGEVVKVDGYVAEVAMFGSGDVVRIDQAQLETVIPKAGGTVVILVGPRRGEEATVEQILTDDFQVELKLLSTGQRVREEYECVSKLLT